jgi:uncharacterized membrane protein YphA (DoxX/SURF4 family)
MDQPSAKPFAILRIAFGLVWIIDACFKWTPGFFNGFTGYLTAAAQGQPAFAFAWINFWLKIININPYAFALAVAILETAIALCLIFGVFVRPTIIIGIILSLIIWATAEGFGGPYMAGSTDIGSAIIYVPVFLALWFGKSWQYYSLDSKFMGK